MTALDERENGYEAEFSHQEELKFRAREKAVKALAIWSAECLRKTGSTAAAYAAKVIAPDISHMKHEKALERIAEALSPVGIGRAEADRTMDRFRAQANAAIRAIT
jgi:hypothetical protein